MFVLNGDITIGSYRFRSVNELSIKETIHTYVNTCVIRIPASARLKQNGTLQTASVKTAHQFNRGDKVSVSLGYNGALKRYFIGFVSRINLTSPVEIECEGYVYQLRNKKNIKKSWKTTTLIDVLKYMVQGTDIKLHPDIPAMPLSNLVVNNASGVELLDYLIDLLKGTLTACFFDDVLYVGLTYADVAKQTVKYKFGWNTINVDNLKYHRADDVNVNIEFKVKSPSGTNTTVAQGLQGGITMRENISIVKESAWLTKIAQTKLQQETFDGYEGDFEAFLIPYCRAGYRAETTDSQYKERGGNYFVESVEVTYGQGGARCIPEIGLKLS